MRTSLLASLLLSSVIASTSCSRDTIVAIAVNNIPTGTTKLDLVTSIDGKDYKVEPIKLENFKDSATIISITVPFDIPNGQLKLAITAQGQKCPLASWSGTIATIEPATYAISAPLTNFTNESINQDLFTVKSITSDDVWAAGANSAMAHWDGCYWKNVQVKTEAPENIFTRLSYHSQIGLWATGSSGLLYKYNTSTSTWEIKKSVRDLYPFVTGSSQAEWVRSMFWSDIAYIEGTSGEFLAIGFNSHPAAKATLKNCMIVRATPSATATEGYTFTKQDTLCNISFQTTPPTPSQAVPPQTPANSNWPTCSSCFEPNQIASFRDGVIIAGNVVLPQIQPPESNKFGAYIKINQLPNLGNPVGRYIIPKSTNANQEKTGNSFSIWGSRFDDFWLSNNRLYHISPTDKDDQNPSLPESIAPMYEDKGTDRYSIIGLWGLNADDFWAIGLPASMISQVHHFTAAQFPSNQIKSKLIDQATYRVPFGAFRYTSIDGTSKNDIWLVGYNGIRAHYDNTDVLIIK